MRPRQLLLFTTILLGCLLCQQADGQEKLTRQLMLVNENDNYSFTYSDRYYTNGTMLRYVQQLPSAKGKAPGLLTVELGQQIFTPYKFNLGYRRFMDRPFTGFLYIRGLYTRFLPAGAVWQYGGTAGVVGEKAFGKEVQRWHHLNFNLKYPHGWETQLKTGVGANLESRYVQPLLQLGSPGFGLQLQGSGQAQVGNLFVQAGTGLQLRVGAVQQPSRSAAFDARMLNGSKKVEWYLYYEPQATAQWYNATLQGTLWQNADHYFTAQPSRLVYQQRMGVVFAPRCWALQAGFTHRSKEATTMRTNENWGTVAAAFRW